MDVEANGQNEFQHQLATNLAEGERDVKEGYWGWEWGASSCCPVQNAFWETKHFFTGYSYIERENDK